MGGAISLSDDNEELIDNLVSAGYLKTVKIEQALRCVDRGDYYPESLRRSAYRDIAWKDGFLHLSAPCIYAKVLECLDIQPGMSFLNLGSGTGYFSTVVGFLLGSNGQNFGVELNEQAVAFSREKLKEFLAKSVHLDALDFCEPKFIAGNCFQLDATGNNSQSFDRVYCGATITTDHVDFLKHFLKIRGLMVYPQEDQLLILRRTDADSFHKRQVLPVSFASMISPPPAQNDVVCLPQRQVKLLKDICRTEIRRIARLSAYEDTNFVLRSLILKPQNYRSKSVFADENERERKRRYNLKLLSNSAMLSCGSSGECRGNVTSNRKQCLSFNLLECEAKAMGIYQFSTHDRPKRQFNSFVRRVVQPLACTVTTDKDEEEAPAASEQRRQKVENIVVPCLNGQESNHLLSYNENNGSLSGQPSTSKAILENSTSYDDSNTSLSEEELLKGTYLPDDYSGFESEPDNESEDLHVINVPLLSHGELPNELDNINGGAVKTSRPHNPVNNSKRYRTKSGYSDEFGHGGPKKMACSNHCCQNLSEYDFPKPFDVEQVIDNDEENIWEEEGHVTYYEDDELDTDKNDILIDGSDMEEMCPKHAKNDHESDDGDGELEEMRRHHAKIDRENSRRNLLKFVRDFDRRIVRLPLPKSLNQYLVYNRPLDFFFSKSE